MPTVLHAGRVYEHARTERHACSPPLLSYERTFCTVGARLFAGQGGSPWSVSCTCRWTISTCSSPVTVVELEDVAYPPRCNPPRGPLRVRAHDRGGIKLEVSRRRLPLDDFVLSVLFQTGSCIFGGSEDLARFFRGSIAKAFGIESEPIPPRFMPEPGTSRRKPTTSRRCPGVVRARERHVVCRLRPSSRPALRSASTDRTSRWGRLRVPSRRTWRRSRPARPESVLLAGPTGTGKTSTVELLPAALDELGYAGGHVFRVDCGELVHASDLRRVLGAPPSYIGYVDEPPLVAALRTPGCILLLDEFEKADEAVHDVFLGLLDDGRLTAPDGETVEAPGAIVALTTNACADELAYRLRDVPPEVGRSRTCAATSCCWRVGRRSSWDESAPSPSSIR